MKHLVLAVLLMQRLTAPDPAQMEKVSDLGYTAVPNGLQLPRNITMGAPSSVATTKNGNIIVYNRGDAPLLEFDKYGVFVRSINTGPVVRAHGMRVDGDDNIWITDVQGHTVTKLSPRGDVLMVIGVKDQPGDWNEAANRRFLNEPADLAFGPGGDIFVLQGHGKADPRVLRFDKNGKFIKTWGGKGTGPGQFDVSHSIVVDRKGLVHIADRQNRRIQVFDTDGKYVRERKYFGLPCGLSINSAGDMYMVSGYAGQIIKLDEHGSPLAATGEAGQGLGKFGEAHYLTFGAGGEIYVADTVNSALQKFVKK